MIYFNGCSFTRGYNLKSNLKYSYPAVVAQELNSEFFNHAKVGGSNERITRSTQNYILLNGRKPVSRNKLENEFLVEKWKKDVKVDFVVIMWTGMNRMEYMQVNQWRTANWDKYELNPKNYYPSTISNISQSKNLQEREYHYLNGFMKWRNARYNLKNTITQMLSTKYFLNALEIPHLFYTFSSRHFKPLLHLLDESYVEATNLEWASVELNKKAVLKELPFLTKDGFHEICKTFGTKDHPDEQGHERMAEVILGDIRKHGYDKEIL